MVDQRACSHTSDPETPRGDGLSRPAVPDVAQLVVDYHRGIYKYAYRLTGNRADAEDLTQQTFLMALERSGQVRDPAKIKGWLFTVLRNSFLKSCRKRVPLPVTSLELDIDRLGESVAAPNDVDGERLQAALDELPVEFRLVLVLFYFEQCSYKEIAGKLDIPIGTVMSRLSRAKRHLRSRLVSSRPRHRPGGSRPRSTAGADPHSSAT